MLAKLRALREDRSGAIMVIAAFMAAFLVGALWYVAGVGNAALFRERMQDGADATAFTAAVFHARGMNIIAMINLIMAAILGVLVALKIAHLLLQITFIITTAICAIEPWGAWACPIAAAAETGDNAVQSIIKVVEPMVNNLLKVLSKLEVGVAKVMPIVAVGESYKMAKKYDNPVQGGFAISDSMVPSDGKFGLPVEEDKFSVLCEKAGEFVAEFALAPFALFGVPTQWANGLVGGLVAMAPSYFCGDDGGGSGSGSGSGGSKPSNVDAAAKQVCDAQKDAIDKSNKANPKKKQSFDYAKCMKDTKKDLAKSESQTLNGSNGGGSSGKTPKKVIDAAKNGNKYFQVMSFVWSDMKLANMGRKQVKIAAWGGGGPALPKVWGKVQLATAEFYYDASGDWSSMKEDSMWNMRWRARLRRYHKEIAPGTEIVQTAISLVSSVPLNLLDGINMLQNGGLNGVANQLLGSDNKKRLSDVYTKNAKKTQGDGGYTKVDSSTKLEIIH